ncbi:MAG: DUF6340 family protein [Bacteroidaceae bacterium]
MNRTFFYSAMLLCLSFSSCKVIETTSVDYLQPADISFPPEVKRVAIVNNLPLADGNNQIKGETKEELQEISKITTLTDGDGKIAAETLAAKIAEGNYFDQVIICDSALRAHDSFTRDPKLEKEEIETLTEDLDVDALFSLEELKIKSLRKICYLPQYELFKGTVDAEVNPLLRVYLRTRSVPMVSLSDRDSIYWEEYEKSEFYINHLLIKDEEVLQEASSFAASLPIKHLLPTWKSMKRYYYASGSIEMRDAAVSVRENMWDNALSLWQRANKYKSDKLKMRTSLNIALYYELKDSLDLAETWASKAKKIAAKKLKKNANGEIEESTQDYALIVLYLEELKTRKAQIQKLSLQMNRFNDDF